MGADLVLLVLVIGYSLNIFFQVAAIAEVRLGGLLEVHEFAVMGFMANHTVTNGYRAVHKIISIAIIFMTGIAQIGQWPMQSVSLPAALVLMASVAVSGSFVAGRADLPNDLDRFNRNGWCFLNGCLGINRFPVSIKGRHALEEKSQDLVPGTTVATADHGQKYSGKYYGISDYSLFDREHIRHSMNRDRSSILLNGSPLPLTICLLRLCIRISV